MFDICYFLFIVYLALKRVSLSSNVPSLIFCFVEIFFFLLVKNNIHFQDLHKSLCIEKSS